MTGKQYYCWYYIDYNLFSSFPTLGGGMSESTRVNLAFEYRATKSYNTKYNQPKPEVITPNTGSVAKLLRNAKNEENKKINGLIL